MSLLRDWRKETGKTQQEMAESLAVNRATYAGWEVRSEIPAEYLRKLRKLGYSGPSSPKPASGVTIEDVRAVVAGEIGVLRGGELAYLKEKVQQLTEDLAEKMPERFRLLASREDLETLAEMLRAVLVKMGEIENRLGAAPNPQARRLK